MKDTLEKFARLKRQLTEERESLTKRLAAINAVLGSAIEAFPASTPGEATGQTAAEVATRGQRSKGKLTLAQAVLDAFSGGEKGNGLRISEILPLVQKTAGKTHEVNRATVNIACLRLRDNGALKNPSRGVYALA